MTIFNSKTTCLTHTAIIRSFLYNFRYLSFFVFFTFTDTSLIFSLMQVQYLERVKCQLTLSGWKFQHWGRIILETPHISETHQVIWITEFRSKVHSKKGRNFRAGVVSNSNRKILKSQFRPSCLRSCLLFLSNSKDINKIQHTDFRKCSLSCIHLGTMKEHIHASRILN